MLVLVLLGSAVAGVVLGFAGVYWTLSHTDDHAQGF